MVQEESTQRWSNCCTRHQRLFAAHYALGHLEVTHSRRMLPRSTCSRRFCFLPLLWTSTPSIIGATASTDRACSDRMTTSLRDMDRIQSYSGCLAREGKTASFLRFPLLWRQLRPEQHLTLNTGSQRRVTAHSHRLICTEGNAWSNCPKNSVFDRHRHDLTSRPDFTLLYTVYTSPQLLTKAGSHRQHSLLNTVQHILGRVGPMASPTPINSRDGKGRETR